MGQYRTRCYRTTGTTLHFQGTTLHFQGTTLHFQGTTLHFQGTTLHFQGTTLHFCDFFGNLGPVDTQGIKPILA